MSGRTPRLYTHNGLSLTVREWAAKTGIPLTTLKARLHGHGSENWSIGRALTQAPESHLFESRPGACKHVDYGVDPHFRAWISAPVVNAFNLT